jgi:general secretion pathway protein H
MQITQKRRSSILSGFTLIELLIVIVIISIVSSVALLTISHNKNSEYFAHEFVQLMALTEHEALLRPATFGIGLTPTSYQFYIYNSEKKWSALTDKNLKPHSISDKIHITLKMNDKIVNLDGKPVIIISDSGDITPFVMFVGAPGKEPLYQIIGEANGNIKSEPFHEE